MIYKREILETLYDDSEKVIKLHDYVVYCTNSSNATILAQYDGMKDGYLTFIPYCATEKLEYRVKPSTIKKISKFEWGE